jgi:hypothetical protein
MEDSTGLDFPNFKQESSHHDLESYRAAVEPCPICWGHHITTSIT